MTVYSLPPLGIIEGFFGRPWPDASRFDAFQFLQTRGFHHYIYAQKADRHLRRAWRDVLPAERLTQLSTLAAQCHKNHLKFGIGLTPYEIHLDYSPDARTSLRRKVLQLNQIGTDILCILFDDMHGAPRLAEIQAQIVGDVTGWSTASTFIVCPTYYSDDPVLEKVFGLAPPRYLQSLGRALDPVVDVFWTGEQVCSSRYPDGHLEEITDRLGRKPYIWDNHLANDGKERCTHLYLRPFDTGFILNSALVSGIVINPMNQPSLARIPLAVYAATLGVCNASENDARFRAQVRSIGGDRLGNELLSDLDLFQYQGLSNIAAPAQTRLIEKYRLFEPDPLALEIGAWLRGDYEFDPNCLTE